MEQPFYRDYLAAHHGITVCVPAADDRQTVHDIIYNELCHGDVLAPSKRRYLEIVGRAIDDGADAVIFGCTEIGLLLADDDLPVPGLDTTRLHAEAAMDFALGNAPSR